MAVVTSDGRILPEPAPVVQIHDLSQGRVDFVVRPWVKTSDYWPMYWELNRLVKTRFDAEGIALAIPRHEVDVVPGPGAPPDAVPH